VSGNPVDLDTNNPDWLPTLHLGKRKQLSESRARAAEERWERARARGIHKSQIEEAACGSDSDVVMGAVEASTQTKPMI